MKQMDLFDELTYIDDVFVLEAHETPVARQNHLNLRRFGVLLAAVIAVIAMSVAVVATMTEDIDSRLYRLWNQFIKQGNNTYFGYVDGYQIELHDETHILDDQEVQVAVCYVYTLNQAELRVTSEGQTMEIKLEAMVLMDDGQVKYKSRMDRGDDAVTVTLDNLIAGEPGTIVHLRRTTSLLGEEGWKTVTFRNTCIANDFGYKLPNGTDIRFPDTKREDYHWWEWLDPTTSGQDAPDEVFLPGKSEFIATIQ